MRPASIERRSCRIVILLPRDMSKGTCPWTRKLFVRLPVAANTSPAARGCARRYCIRGGLLIENRRRAAMPAVRIFSLAVLLLCGRCLASPVVLNRNGAYVAVESYAPNIVRISIATDYATAAAPPGYGFLGKEDSRGFRHTEGAAGDDFRSSGLQLHVDAQQPPSGAPSAAERYFAPSLPPVALEIRNARGETVLAMTDWQMAPHTVSGERTYQVGASFAAPADEHFYGLGQNQDGILDLRGR